MRRAALALAPVAVVLGALQYAWDGTVGLWLANGAWTAAAAFAVLGAAVGRANAPADGRRAWDYLLWATGAWLAGQLLWNVASVPGARADALHVADAAWLGFAALAAAGLYRLAPAGGRIRTLAGLDLAALVAAVVALSASFLWERADASQLDDVSMAIAVAYPIAYVGLAAVAVQALLGALLALRSRALLLVIGGIVLQSVGFAAWAPAVLAQSYVAGSTWMDATWVAGMLMIGAGGLAVGARDALPESTAADLRWRTPLPWLGLGLLLAAQGYSAVSDRPLGARLVLIGGIAVVGLLLALRSVVFVSLYGHLLRRAETANAALERRNAELQAFAYSASHDLRAPLVSIEGFVSSLERRAGDTLDERSRVYLERIRVNAHSLQRLIRDLLQYARYGADGSLDAVVDAHSLAERVVGELGERAAPDGHRVELVTRLPPLRAHPVGFAQALTNLVENALAHGANERPARVAVGAAQANGCVEVWVEDDGPGVPPEEREHLFDLFSRGRTGRERSPGGTGMGLALVKKIAESSGGSVRYESPPEGGARFVLSFPKGAR